MPSVCFLQKNAYSGLLPIFKIKLVLFILILSCVNSLSILDINPLLGHIVCKYLLSFSRLPCCFVGLHVLGFFFFFFYIEPAWAAGIFWRLILINSVGSFKLLNMLSSRSFMVSCLTLRSLILSLFLYIMWEYLHIFTCSCPVFPASLTEETVISPLYNIFLPPLW